MGTGMLFDRECKREKKEGDMGQGSFFCTGIVRIVIR
jgi:hypothetical protein